MTTRSLSDNPNPKGCWVGHFARLIEPYPGGTDILFWPEPGVDDSPEGIIATIGQYFHYFHEHGRPCFGDVST